MDKSGEAASLTATRAGGVMTFEEWWKGYTGSDKDKSLVMGKVYTQSAWDYQQARIEALERLRLSLQSFALFQQARIDELEAAAERYSDNGPLSRLRRERLDNG